MVNKQYSMRLFSLLEPIIINRQINSKGHQIKEITRQYTFHYYLFNLHKKINTNYSYI